MGTQQGTDILALHSTMRNETKQALTAEVQEGEQCVYSEVTEPLTQSPSSPTGRGVLHLRPHESRAAAPARPLGFSSARSISWEATKQGWADEAWGEGHLPPTGYPPRWPPRPRSLETARSSAEGTRTRSALKASLLAGLEAVPSVQFLPTGSRSTSCHRGKPVGQGRAGSWMLGRHSPGSFHPPGMQCRAALFIRIHRCAPGCSQSHA